MSPHLPRSPRAAQSTARSSAAALLAVLLPGCVLADIPPNTMAGILTVNAERIALLSEVQPEAPAVDDPEARFVFEVECTDGAQVVLVDSTLNAEGQGLFEVVLPPGDGLTPWTCSFSAPGQATVEDGGVTTTIESTYALGALRDCDAGGEALLFSWNGASRWLDVVEADGIDVCARSSAEAVTADALSYASSPAELDGEVWCGAVTIRQSIGRPSAVAVGWSPVLCQRLASDPVAGDTIQAAIYHGIEQGTEYAGCPLLPPLQWRALVQHNEAISFSTRPEELNNPAFGGDFDLLGVLWSRSTRGPEGTFSLTTWTPDTPEGGEPGGMVLETAGPMVPLDALDMPAVLFRATDVGCPPPLGG